MDAIGIGVLVGVIVGVEVGLGVAVGVGVAVGLGVTVGPRICPGPQAEIVRLRTKMRITVLRCFDCMDVSLPERRSGVCPGE